MVQANRCPQGTLLKGKQKQTGKWGSIYTVRKTLTSCPLLFVFLLQISHDRLWKPIRLKEMFDEDFSGYIPKPVRNENIPQVPVKPAAKSCSAC